MKCPNIKRISKLFTGTVLTLCVAFLHVSVSTESVHADIGTTYTIDNFRNLQDFLLAKNTPDLSSKNYDLNYDDR